MAGFQQLRVTREVDFTGATQINVGGVPNHHGTDFYVDCVDGVDTDDGKSWEYAKLTIEGALDKCTSGKDDYIYVRNLPYGTSVETFPITVGKDNVHIICVSHGGMRGGFNNILDGDGENVFELAANLTGAEIAGFSMFSSGKACIDTLGASWGVYIHDCAFGDIGACNYGIMCGGETATHGSDELAFGVIENCLFSKSIAVDGIATGIEYGSLSWTYIRNNTFYKVAGVGVNFAQSNPAACGGGIFDNRFFQDNAISAGGAITITAAKETMVDGNRAMEDNAEPGSNPYVDNSSTYNAWGLNYMGVLATYPATT